MFGLLSAYMWVSVIEMGSGREHEAESFYIPNIENETILSK